MDVGENQNPEFEAKKSDEENVEKEKKTRKIATTLILDFSD